MELLLMAISFAFDGAFSILIFEQVFTRWEWKALISISKGQNKEKIDIAHIILYYFLHLYVLCSFFFRF